MAPPIPGRIPWTAVAAWCQRRGYGDQQEEQLEAGISVMDAEFVAWHAEERRKAEARRPKR